MHKITKIKLTSYLHFKNHLEIDLTYPKGHDKAGEPLDKICFIGQSGTGKTVLLNLIKHCVCEEQNSTGLDKAALAKDAVEVFYRMDGKHYSKISTGNLGFTYIERPDSKPPKKVEDSDLFLKQRQHSLSQCDPWLMNFPFCVVKPERDDEQPRVVHDPSKGELDLNQRIWDFDQLTINTIWNIVFNEVGIYLQDFQNRKLKQFDHISANPVTTKKFAIDARKSVLTFKKWVAKHPNPIQRLADECLNPIFSYFNLKVEADLAKYPYESAQSKRQLRLIIKDKNGREIPHSFLSSGTKQILHIAIPLMLLEPRNTIILFDQPETSIYPNVQCMLPEIFLNCAKGGNQFFFATHSPIVASAFDPWEIVQLDFDHGCVNRIEYFSKTREVGNYHTFPKKLRWDSSYRLLFNLDKEGNEQRETSLTELTVLERKLKKTFDPAERGHLEERYDKLAAELDWNVG